MQKLDYRDFLSSALQSRQYKNPNYSMRAFARDLGVSPQKISQVMKGTTGLSPLSAADLALKLNLKKAEAELFVALVEMKHSRSANVKRVAGEKVKHLRNLLGFKEIGEQETSIISEWYYLATHILIDVFDFRGEPEWIAKRLGITEDQAAMALDTLVKLRLIRKRADGSWVRLSEKLSIHSSKPSQLFRKFYRQIWNVVEKTMDQEKVEDRVFAASVMSINTDDVEYVRNETEKFRKNILRYLADRPGKSNRVYALAFQFCPVDQIETEQ